MAQDACDFHDLLIDPQCCAFKSENVQRLVDSQATLAALRQELAALAKRCNSDTTVVIFFSGHGGRIAGDDDGYLIPADVGADLAGSALSSKDFTEALQAIPARRVVVFLDCCHAGGIGHVKQVPGGAFKSGLPTPDLQILASGYGRLIIASSRDTESSLVLPNDSNSLFSKHLLKGMQGAAAGNDGYVRVMDLFHYLQPKVKADSRGTQNPFFKAYVEENFALAFYSTRVTRKNSDVEQRDYPFDVFISYLDLGRDYDWVLNNLVPLLESVGLKVTDSHAAPVAGATRISNMEVGFRISRYILLVMSDAYLEDNAAMFENVLFQDMGMYEGSWRVIPVYWEPLNKSLIPARLRMISGINLADQRRRDRETMRLLESLQSK